MPSAREWIGNLMLHAPTPLRSLRDVPVLGHFIHRLSHQIVPADERVWAQIKSGPARGLWIELNPRTGQNYMRGDAEAAVQKALAERLRPGMVFYDLGANIGLFSLLGARLVGPTGKVFSFEPDPEVAARLRRNVERNEFTNVTIVEAGIWSSSGHRYFTAAETASPDRGVGKFVAEESAAAGMAARSVALDDFIQSAPAPDAIKCDIEGAEAEAFQGGEKLLQARRPWIICEMHSETNDAAVRSQLSRFGYALEAIDGNHVLALPGDQRTE